MLFEKLFFIILYLSGNYRFSRAILSGVFIENLQQFGLQGVLQNVVLQQNVPKNNEIYDFIIVGGGSAGCVVANRLSENPNWRVALLEAGGLETVAHLIPSVVSFMPGTSGIWDYGTIPQKRACFGMYNNICKHPRGRVLGGTSSINFMIYNRGNRNDFDSWAAAGNPGWSYEEVLPYFLKSEAAKLNGLEDSPYHNRSGPLAVEHLRYRSQILEAYIQGAQEAGHSLNDYNGETQLGVSYLQSNTKNGRRHSAYRAFLQPIMQGRQNLRIFTNTRVTKVLIDPKTKVAYGVEFLHKKRMYVFKAKSEVILSAGSFNSPQLLMLSGVGPSDVLNAIGIQIIQELPVGVRMYEHASHLGPTFLVNTTGQSLFVERATPRDIFGFFLGRPDTLLSSPGSVEALTFLKLSNSDKPADWPDVEIIFSSGSLASDGGTGFVAAGNIRNEIYERVYQNLHTTQQDHFSVLIMPFHPKSIGRVWLQSKNPLQWPIIDPNYFADPDDVEVMLAGIKAAIAISQTPSMQRIGARLLDTPIPGCENYIFGSDDYWRCSIRTMTYTLHHQVATCRMGPSNDSTAVVNAQLQVHGIRKLRIVDSSIVPFPPTSHTNAISIMIGEKGADMIRQTWEKQFLSI